MLPKWRPSLRCDIAMYKPHMEWEFSFLCVNSPPMLLRFWWMAWWGELGMFTELLSFWGSWLAVVLMNSIADCSTRNCRATAISAGKTTLRG